MYDKIEEEENLLVEARAKKQAIEAEKLTADNIYKVLIYFEKLYGVMNDVERRRFIEALISEIQIFPERQPNGQWLKSIKFKLPIIGENMELSLDNDKHVETVVLLTRKRKSKDYKVEIEIPIDVDGSKTYTEEKSTYQNIKKFIKAKYGVNTHTKDIAEVKRDCGVEMRLNYNISKKENPKIRHCTQEKRGYIMDALEYYQVI